MGALSLCTALFLALVLFYEPATLTLAGVASAPAAPPPPDFTPLSSPPPAFQPTPAQASQLFFPISARPSPLSSYPTALPVEALLEKEGQGSSLVGQRLVSILLLGSDARPDEFAGRTDSLIVLFLDLEAPQATLISIPRDLWVTIPGYGAGRINTAYTLGQRHGQGSALARQTVSQLLGLPIQHVALVDFDGFRQLVDRLGGIELEVPEAINDPAFPDAHYGTLHFQIAAGWQQLDGEMALRYARTRHGSNDLDRAARQQAVLEAIRQRALDPARLPELPGHLLASLEHIESTLSTADLFFLARIAQRLEHEQIQGHVIRAPLLWNGVTADGQQVLLYDPVTLQQAVQGWLRRR